MTVLSWSFICCLAIFSLQSIAQKEPKVPTGADTIPGIEFYYSDAQQYYESGNYTQALPLYETLARLYPKEVEYKLRAGVCYLSKTDELEKALGWMEQAKERKPKTPDLSFYMGKAYAVNYRFDEAIASFNEAVGNKKTNAENKAQIPTLIKQCENAKTLVDNPVDVTVTNLGAPVNSQWQEYCPVISADEGTLMYTYRGDSSVGGLQDPANYPDSILGYYFEDIRFSEQVDGHWEEPKGLKGINTFKHEATVALSADGQVLFVYIDDPSRSGEIYISYNVEGVWTQPEPLPFNSDQWEGSASITTDGHTIYFSSEREGGLGGKDIYKCVLQEDGSFSDPVNLGAPINSANDEDSPYIHADGVTLYFCSNGEGSMGGYDIFEVHMDPDTGPDSPRNVGYPVNTPNNDIYFVVTPDGQRAYFSSARKDGLGGQDIYVMDVSKVVQPTAVAMVNGKVTKEQSPIWAGIVVKDESGNEVARLETDAVSGDYSVTLQSDKKYEFTYMPEGEDEKIERADFMGITEYTEKIINVDFGGERLVIDGTVHDCDDPEIVYQGIRVRLLTKDSVEVGQLISDEKGYFAFENLSPEDAYFLVLDAVGASSDRLCVFGYARLGAIPVAGMLISTADTDADGRYELLQKFDYDQLPPDDAIMPPQDELDGEALYNLLLSDYGDRTAEGLIFKVQVAAYQFSENYKHDHIDPLGTVDRQLLADGVTRFTVGEYTSLTPAEVMRQRCINAGQTDAFVIAFVNGQRTYMKDVLEIFKK